MPYTITIKDEAISGQISNKHSFQVQTKTIKVEALIKKRVFQEVAAYNRDQPAYFKGLVQPTETELTLNGFRMKTRRKIDPEKQYYLALDAFQKNVFFILINNRQVTSLTQEILLEEKNEVSFIKLTPLVGG